MIKITFHNGDMIETKTIENGTGILHDGILVNVQGEVGNTIFSVCSSRFICAEDLSQ